MSCGGVILNAGDERRLAAREYLTVRRILLVQKHVLKLDGSAVSGESRLNLAVFDWEFGNLGIWRSGDLEIQKFGDLGT